MNAVAAYIYWVIVAAWAAVLITVSIAYLRNRKTFGSARLLLLVVSIDTVRNIVENIYFGAYFGATYGILPQAVAVVLGNPALLILPKLFNVFASVIVLGVLLFRWLPSAVGEKAEAEKLVQDKTMALRREVEEHRRLFQTSADLIVVTDLDRVIVQISDSCSGILGYLPHELAGRYGGDLIVSSDLEALRSELLRCVAGEPLKNLQCNFVHKDGRLVAISLSGVWSPQVGRFFLIGRDTTSQKIAEEKLQNLAHFDQLTGLPNRHSALAEIRLQLESSRGLSIAMFDLDGFKDVNDTLGHAAGDRVLCAAAKRIERAALVGCKFYRLGGDEFLAIFPDQLDPLALAADIDHVIHRLEEPFSVDGHTFNIGASVGSAIAPTDGADADELIASADLALYDAKAAGRRCYRMFVPSMRAAVQARREMGIELRRAWQKSEFVLHYQPQYCLADGKIVGAEALLRWQHPTRGLLSPGLFVDALSTSPEAPAVGSWIILEACRQAMEWHARGLPLIRMGVNLFPSQFQSNVLLSDVDTALSTTNLPSHKLELEITENIILNNSEAILSTLETLRSRGVGMAFDDFGTGYASLSCLTHFPLNRIKIDRSFVKSITSSSSSEDTAITSSIIALAHDLGCSVIAEGVETSDQVDFLTNKGCDEVQGFLYSRPLTSSNFEALLRQTILHAAEKGKKSLSEA
jgi:diguanylate cyclase (GGDEF)-like protein/PAS domain S-box-containing protein